MLSSMMRGRARAAAGAVIALLAFGPAAYSAVPSLEERMAGLASLGARIEGSAAEAEAFGRIESSLRAMGLSPRESGFDDAFEDYSRSRIVEATVAGERDDELAILVPVNSWTGAKDGYEGAFGIALALDEAARLAADAKAGAAPPLSVRFVFLGGEKRGRKADDHVAALGSQVWIARRNGDGRLAALYLDLPFPSRRIEMLSAGRRTLSPYWYFESMRRALEVSGVRYGIEANRQEAFKLGLASDFGPATPYLEAGIPAIELRGPQEADTGDGAWFSEAVASFAKGMSGGFPESWDRHYFITEIGRSIGVLREKTYVAMLVASLAVIALSILAATVARRRLIKKLLRKMPAFLVQFLALFCALAAVVVAGRGLAALESLVLGSARAWTLLPRVFVIARTFFCFLLFLAILSQLVGRRILTTNRYFYEFAGLFCLAIDVLVFSVVDLSASFYFIWALVVVEVSLAIHRRWASMTAYAVMYFPLLAIAAELLRKPDLAAYGRVISPDLGGALTFSALSLPFFVFTTSPFLLAEPREQAAHRRIAVLLAAAALAFELFALVAFRVVVPGTGAARSDLGLSESVDQDTGRFELRLSGAQRIGRGILSLGGRKLEYSSRGDLVLLSGADPARRIGIAETRSTFLDRQDENLSVSFESPPYSLDFTLESDEEILIYECSLPYKVSVDGRSATIYAGVNPGKEFPFTITVPDSFEARLVVRARYLEPLADCSLSSGAPLRMEGATVTASKLIGAGKGR